MILNISYDETPSVQLKQGMLHDKLFSVDPQILVNLRPMAYYTYQ